MTKKDVIIIHQLKPETATGNSREFPEFANYQTATFYLNCTALAGANGTLVVTIQEQDPVSLTWSDGAAGDPIAIVTFTTLTQGVSTLPNTQRTVVNPLSGIRYRAVWTFAAGLTSATFSISAITSTEEAAT